MNMGDFHAVIAIQTFNFKKHVRTRTSERSLVRIKALDTKRMKDGIFSCMSGKVEEDHEKVNLETKEQFNNETL